MHLACDNSERIERLRTIFTICFWDTVAAPLPADMQALLLSLDCENIEQDCRDALALMQAKPKGKLALVA